MLTFLILMKRNINIQLIILITINFFIHIPTLLKATKEVKMHLVPLWSLGIWSIFCLFTQNLRKLLGSFPKLFKLRKVKEETSEAVYKGCLGFTNYSYLCFQAQRTLGISFHVSGLKQQHRHTWGTYFSISYISSHS